MPASCDARDNARRKGSHSIESHVSLAFKTTIASEDWLGRQKWSYVSLSRPSPAYIGPPWCLACFGNGCGGLSTTPNTPPPAPVSKHQQNLRLHRQVVLGQAGAGARATLRACAHTKQKEASTMVQHLSASASHVTNVESLQLLVNVGWAHTLASIAGTTNSLRSSNWCSSGAR